jgi:hypothetical protein
MNIFHAPHFFHFQKKHYFFIGLLIIFLLIVSNNVFGQNNFYNQHFLTTQLHIKNNKIYKKQHEYSNTNFLKLPLGMLYFSKIKD